MKVVAEESPVTVAKATAEGRSSVEGPASPSPRGASDVQLPSGRQTDNTLGVLVAGTLTPDLVVLMDPGAHRELPTSTAPHFRRLGYTTRFFYGGYAGWGRLDEFVLGQGFERLHTASELPGAPGNAWGVWDAHLLDHVLATVDASQPSFNVILTTNNHSPFDLPESLLPPLPALPAQAPAWDTMTRRVLQHEMYVDREVSRFVDAASRRFPGALFVITGDHQAYAARYTLPHADPLHPMTVPLIFTGAGLPANLRGRHSHPASHMDIAPTLYALLAPGALPTDPWAATCLRPGPPPTRWGRTRCWSTPGWPARPCPHPPPLASTHARRQPTWSWHGATMRPCARCPAPCCAHPARAPRPAVESHAHRAPTAGLALDVGAPEQHRNERPRGDRETWSGRSPRAGCGAGAP